MIIDKEMNIKELKDNVLNNPEFEMCEIQFMKDDIMVMSLVMNLFIYSDAKYELSDQPNKECYFYIHNRNDFYTGVMIPFDNVVIKLTRNLLRIRMVYYGNY